jgi:hypothetical protein
MNDIISKMIEGTNTSDIIPEVLPQTDAVGIVFLKGVGSEGSYLVSAAAAEMYLNGEIGTIVLSGGATSKLTYETEARNAFNMMREEFPQIPKSAYLLEEEANSTDKNAEKVADLLSQKNLLGKNKVFISDILHQSRVKRRAERHNLSENARFEVMSTILAKNPRYNERAMAYEERMKKLYSVVQSLAYDTIDSLPLELGTKLMQWKVDRSRGNKPLGPFPRP